MISDARLRRFLRFTTFLTLTVLMTSQVSYGQAQAAPKVWSGGVMLDLSIFKNSTTQTSLSLGGKVIRAGQMWSHQFDGSHAFAEVSVPGFEQTVSDAQNLSSLSRRTLTDNIFLLFSPSYKRNAIQSVDYQFSEMVGIGFRHLLSK
jgi:hypothetical protein